MAFPSTKSQNKPLRYINTPAGILKRNRKKNPSTGYELEQDFTQIISDILCCGICCDGITFRDVTTGKDVVIFVDSGVLGALPKDEFNAQYR